MRQAAFSIEKLSHSCQIKMRVFSENPYHKDIWKEHHGYYDIFAKTYSETENLKIFHKTVFQSENLLRSKTFSPKLDERFELNPQLSLKYKTPSIKNWRENVILSEKVLYWIPDTGYRILRSVKRLLKGTNLPHPNIHCPVADSVWLVISLLTFAGSLR